MNLERKTLEVKMYFFFLSSSLLAGEPWDNASMLTFRHNQSSMASNSGRAIILHSRDM